jgi:hypothetical protein
MNYKGLFLISLAVNVGVGFYAFRRSTAAPEGSAKEKSSAPEPLIARPAVKDVESTDTNTVIKRFNWESVEASDYKQYIANLRSVGCPEETIRDIIRADVNRLYEEKKKRVRKEAPRFEYWKGEDFNRGAGREAWTKLFELNEERDAVLRALGIEPDYSQQPTRNPLALYWQLDFLDENRQAQILRLNTELEDKFATLTEDLDPNGFYLLIKEKDDAIKRLLTPEEAVQYDLRMSDTTGTLRGQLVGFEPTEQEFIALFKLRREYDDKFPAFPMPNLDDLTAAERRAKNEAAEAAKQQLEEQIKQTLGAQRYADYEIAQDDDYGQIYRVAEQAGLGVPEAKQVYAMRKAAEDQAARIRNDQSLTPEQRGAGLAGIRQETEASIHAVLGGKGWAQFNRGSNKRWFDGINLRSDQQNTEAPPP